MTADSPENTSNSEEDRVSPGALLKQAREKRQLSLRDVAGDLRLLPQQISYLENDEFSRFNGDLFCRAHLNSYARLVELDGEEIIALYQQLANRPVLAKANKNQVAGNQVQRPGRGHSLRYWGVGAAASLAVVLWFSQPDSVETPLPLSDVVDPNDQSTLEVLDANNIYAEGNIHPGNSGYPEKVPAGSELLSEFGNSDQESVVLDLPAGSLGFQARPQGTAEQQAQTFPGSDQLRFSFSADCWVEVSDGDGVTIFAALKRAEESLVLEGKGPFKVLLGYAHGVSLNYNGEPIEINVNARNNSARLVVGNLPVR